MYAKHYFIFMFVLFSEKCGSNYAPKKYIKDELKRELFWHIYTHESKQKLTLNIT